MQARIWLKSIAVTALMALLLAPCLFIAQASSRHIPPNSTHPTGLALPPCSLSLYTDFDGDHQPDKAELFSGGFGKIIEISFGNSRRSHVYFDPGAADRGELLTADINHDSHPDLIWVSEARSRKPLVWLGDGQGNFAVSGEGDSFQAEINALLGRDDETGSQFGRGNNSPHHALAPPVSKDLALVSTDRPEPEEKTRIFLITADPCGELAVYLAHLHERGPPPSLF